MAEGGYKEWVNGIVESGQTRGEHYSVGNVPGKVLDKLRTRLRVSLVVIDDEKVFHLCYDKNAQCTVLSADEISQDS